MNTNEAMKQASAVAAQQTKAAKVIFEALGKAVANVDKATRNLDGAFVTAMLKFAALGEKCTAELVRIAYPSATDGTVNVYLSHFNLAYDVARFYGIETVTKAAEIDMATVGKAQRRDAFVKALQVLRKAKKESGLVAGRSDAESFASLAANTLATIESGALAEAPKREPKTAPKASAVQTFSIDSAKGFDMAECLLHLQAVTKRIGQIGKGDNRAKDAIECLNDAMQELRFYLADNA